MQTDTSSLANNSHHCWTLHVSSVCTVVLFLHGFCGTLLHVVASCCTKFETGQTFKPRTPTISFFPWSPKHSAKMLDSFAQVGENPGNEVASDWGFSAFPANRERQEITWPGPCRQVRGLRFTCVRLDHASEVSNLPQGFLHPKTSQSHVWEEIRLFSTVLLSDHQILFQKNVILKTISQLK